MKIIPIRKNTIRQFFKSLPEEQSEIYYPEDYIEKVKSEIEEWRMQVESILSKEIPESEIPKLENATVNENVLTAKQLDFLHSVSLDSYMQRVQRFCTRAAIFVNTAFYKPENETEQWYVAAQRKIEKELCDKHE
ncbi:hypothetical protein NQ318_012412 [Aromia moschata]|uniref:Uncharacterized protein n=1 Tax=Aromia moschata TaxID=1265417 RepID=A0AAV8Y3T9_9CUCU|nr:hypothetical protein NQ318_012412 [Aromia moschata]